MTDANELAVLYEATAQHLRYAIGLVASPEHGHVPVIQIYQPDWDRALLAIVRSSLAEGLELAIKPTQSDTVEVHLSARQRIEVQARRDGQTSVLRAPAWDAQLGGVALAVAEQFQADCGNIGSFTLVLRTRVWACSVQVACPSGKTCLGAILPADDPWPEVLS